MAKTDFQTVDEYIATFPEDVQAVLRKIRQAIRKAAPAAAESISYQIPAYTLHGPVFYFAAWKQHYSLYPVTGSLLDVFGAELAAYEVVKSTIKFRYDQPVPVQLIEAMAKHRAAEHVQAAAVQAAAARVRAPRK